MNTILPNILTISAWTMVATTLGVAAMAIAEKKPVPQPINAISHIFFGDKAFSVAQPEPKFLVSGLVLNFGAMLSWAVITEILLRSMGALPGAVGVSFAVALFVTVLAYVTDFYIVPKRLTPGFEHVLSQRSLYAVYAILALGTFAGIMSRS